MAHAMCRPRDQGRAKYQLLTSVRTHLGAQDDAFGCMGVGEDAEGKQGVFLRKNVIEIAGRALKTNIRCLAPKVLPWVELVSSLQLLYLMHMQRLRPSYTQNIVIALL